MRFLPLLLCLGCLGSALIGASVPAAAQSSKAEVLKTGQAVFDAMARRDTVELKRPTSILAPLGATAASTASSWSRPRVPGK